MAKKPTSSPSKAAPKVIARKPAVAAKPEVVATTAVRNSPLPKAAAPVARKSITPDQIAIRAFEISCGPNCGSQDDNWFRAERELRGGL
jgi:hypothetical protein